LSKVRIIEIIKKDKNMDIGGKAYYLIYNQKSDEW